MAQTTTTISAAVTASDQIIPVTSAIGFTAGNYLRIDNEFMVVVSVSGTNIPVNLRGDQGSGAVAHNILAVADTGLSSDLADLPLGETTQVDPSKETIVSYSAAGAIAIPTQNTLVLLNADAKANTVTYTAGFYGDTTSSDVATFAAKTGASFSIIARGGTWGIIALGNVTLA